MTRTLPTYAVEIAWDTQLTGVFRADISLADGPDVASGTWGNNSYDDMTAVTKAAEITRGQAASLSGVEQGTCRMVLRDDDGTYNPENPTSPLSGLVVDMRPVRVRASHLGTVYGLFYGYIQEIVHDPVAKETLITAGDFFEWLAGIKPTIAATGSTTVGAAIGLILDAAEWTDANMRDLDAGDPIPDFSADGTKTGIDLIRDLMVTDLGMPFVSGSGVFTYRERSTFYRRQTAVDTFDGSVIRSARPSLTTRNVVNRQTVTRTGGVAQTATNEASRKARGYRDGSPIESGYLNSDAQALNLAEWIVLVKGTGQSPTRDIEIPNTDDTQIARQLSRELADYVTVEESRGGTATDGTIQQLIHEIRPGLHSVRCLVAKKPATLFTADVSLADGPDVAGY